MSDLGLPRGALGAVRRHYAPAADWTRDPVGWVAETQPRVHLWSRQREVMEAVRDHKQVAVKACHSSGKSYVAAEVIAWWVDSHPVGESVVVTSAPTGHQVKAILWKEMNRLHRSAGLRGRMNLTEWYDDENELVAFGRKPSDQEPTAFQGFHAKYVLVVLDEACGIPESLWDAAASLASNEYGRVLAIGNPDDPEAYFAKVFQTDAWHQITISAFDTPNLTDEEVPEPVALSLISEGWVRQRAEVWGERSPVYVSKVLGQFPSDATDGVVPSSWVARCRYHELAEEGDVHLGLDVSAGGADRTVIFARRGPVVLGKHVLTGEADPLVMADWVLGVVLETGARWLKVDSIGVGWGVGGTIDGWHRDGLHDCVVVPVNVSESADDSEHFLNLRAEVWWGAREACRLREVDLRALDDDDVAELTCVRYHHRNPRSRVQVERKDEVKKRLGRSPDLADALCLCLYDPRWESEDLTDEVTSERIPARAPLRGR